MSSTYKEGKLSRRRQLYAGAEGREEYVLSLKLNLNLRDMLKREIRIMFGYKFAKLLIRALHMFNLDCEDRTFERLLRIHD